MNIAEKTLQLKQDFDDVYEAGKKAEVDNFTNDFQDDGNRTDYAYAWCRWNVEMFKRMAGKTVSTSNFEGAFYYTRMLIDLPAFLEEHRITINVVNPTRYAYQRTFRGSQFTRVGVIDVSNSAQGTCQFSETFSSAINLKTIDKIILNENGTDTWYDTAFSGCTALEDLTIEGVIGRNGFSVQSCKSLTHDSLMSILYALQDKTGDTSGTIWVVIIGATNKEKLTEEELLIAYNKGWEVR